MVKLLEINGSYGEGGGAVLRNSIALSAALRLPVRVYNIRAGRREPGLKMQHLTGVKALAEVCGAQTAGVAVGSTEVVFSPGKIKGGKFKFDVGTAGSLSLVLQSLMPALAFAQGETEFELVGGTNVAWSPPVEYLQNVFLPVAALMGFRGEVEVKERGFYPVGGGRVIARFTPVNGALKPLRLAERGELIEVKGVSVASNLPVHVAERQAVSAEEELRKAGVECKLERVNATATCPGSTVVVWAKFSSGSILGGSSLGERGKPAEKVGMEAAAELVKTVKSNACVDVHLCDQLLAFAALARGESEFTAQEWSRHSETNAWLVRQFIKKEVKIKQEAGLVRAKLEGVGLAKA